VAEDEGHGATTAHQPQQRGPANRVKRIKLRRWSVRTDRSSPVRG
jgi:hypothetical protein